MTTEKLRRYLQRIPHTLPLLLVLALGFVLRIWGITWSLPHGEWLSFHPDEIFQVAAAARIDFTTGQLNPGFYNYGAMYFYIVSFFTTLATGFGLIGPGSLGDRYLVARLVNVVLGSAIPLLVYVAVIRLYNRPTALLAALFAAITPIAVVHSHFATVDVAATFWVSACLAASASIFRQPATRQYLLAGLFAGFAAATKYTAGIALVAPLAAHIAAQWDSPFRAKLASRQLLPLIGMAIAGFIIGNPGSILWTDEFLRGLTFEFRHAQTGHGMVFAGTGPGWLFHLTSSLWYGFGWPFLFLCIAGLVVMVLDKSRKGWAFVAFAIVYYVMIGFAKVRFARYIIPLTPVLSIATAVAIVYGYGLAARLGGRATWAVMCALALYYTFSYAAALDRLFTLPDTRVRAAEWIEQNVPKGSVIALPTVPWFYSPALSPGFTKMWPAERLAAMSQVKSYRLVTNPDKPWDWQMPGQHSFFCTVISDFERQDAERAEYTDALFYIDTWEHLSRRQMIENDLRWGGFIFGATRDLPHDLKYTSPTLTIYRRRG